MKRYKKGFTLIELLAVIVVLGVLAVIVVPLVFDQLTNAKGKLYNKQVDLIEKASQRWGEENDDQLPQEQDQYVYVSIDDLKEAGFIDRNRVKDPRDGSRMNGCVVISYNAEYHQNIYQYKETPCSELHEGGTPNIIVEGGSLQGVEVYTTYVLPKVSAKSESGTKLEVEGPVIRKDNKVVEEISTKKIKDLYSLTYRALDEASMKEAEKKVKVKVIDTIAPEIEVNGKKSSHTITHELGTTFKIPTPKVTDNSRLTCVKDAKSGCRYTVTTNVAANKVGTYQVVYTATDAGEDLVGPHPNTSAYILTVKVIDTKAPVIKKIEPNKENWTNQDVTLTIIPEGPKEEIKEYSFDNGKTWQKSDQKTFTTNQTVTVLIKDYSGNISKPKTYIISNIDKTAPSCSGNVSVDYKERSLTVASGYVEAGWVNATQRLVTSSDPIVVTATCTDKGDNNTPGSGCKEATKTANIPEKWFKGTKSFTVTDKAGNTATCQSKEIKVDQYRPYTPRLTKIQSRTGGVIKSLSNGDIIMTDPTKYEQNKDTTSFRVDSAMCQGDVEYVIEYAMPKLPSGYDVSRRNEFIFRQVPGGRVVDVIAYRCQNVNEHPEGYYTRVDTWTTFKGSPYTFAGPAGVKTCPGDPNPLTDSEGVIGTYIGSSTGVESYRTITKSGNISPILELTTHWCTR